MSKIYDVGTDRLTKLVLILGIEITPIAVQYAVTCQPVNRVTRVHDIVRLMIA